MRLGDLLIQAKLVTPEQVDRALELGAVQGGRLGDHLISMGAITQAKLDSFLYRTPAEPGSLKDTRIDENELLSLMMKLMYVGRLECGKQLAEAIKLPFHIVVEIIKIAVERKLLYTKGIRLDNKADMNYGFTGEGERFAADALSRSQYTGPCPVTIEEFTYQVNLQKITNEVVTFQRVRESISDLAMEDSLIEQCGPALNSGRAMLLYGPPGNGKTTFALRLANVFRDLIYVPYSVIVEGQIIRFFDPSIHIPMPAPPVQDDKPSFMRREEFDPRWIPIKRPFVVAGGELTLEMLDLRYEPTSNFYEAPLHMKALGGCFVIDDFGRQLVSPTTLLNRWIVPLESRIDYLKLHTGKSFSIPFEEMVMFSTNLEPEQLMDPAFLRRLPYKVEIGAPSLELFRQVFTKECSTQGMVFSEEIFEWIVYKIQVEKELELAFFQPRFILDQVTASCRFVGKPPYLEPRFIEYAVDNLRVRRAAGSETPIHAQLSQTTA